jgi:hypothetical protein
MIICDHRLYNEYQDKTLYNDPQFIKDEFEFCEILEETSPIQLEYLPKQTREAMEEFGCDSVIPIEDKKIRGSKYQKSGYKYLGLCVEPSIDFIQYEIEGKKEQLF